VPISDVDVYRYTPVDPVTMAEGEDDMTVTTIFVLVGVALAAVLVAVWFVARANSGGDKESRE
jgi:hypothetical protein